ncbi:MAG: hypothetical protein LC808_13005 [Actinobacteria bacterium]|nr:hypothetical protein [Actinomycetota bacterium]
MVGRAPVKLLGPELPERVRPRMLSLKFSLFPLNSPHLLRYYRCSRLEWTVWPRLASRDSTQTQVDNGAGSDESSDRDSSGFRSDAVSLLVAVYNALRSEVAYRTAAQHTLLGLSLTGFAAIGGLVITGRAAVALLLIVPLFASTVGLLWLDHAHAIFDIADCIESDLNAEAKELTGRAMLGVQPWPERRVGRRGARWLWAGPVFLGYVLPSVASSIFAIPIAFNTDPTAAQRGAGTEWAVALWFAGIIVTFFLLFTWLSVLARSAPRSARDDERTAPE